MGRVEVLTGRECRRRWTREEKLAILKEAATSGLRVSEVARRHDVVPQQIYQWRRHLLAAVRDRVQGDSDVGPAFLPVTVVPASPEDGVAPTPVSTSPVRSCRSSRIEVRCRGGRSLAVAAGIAPAELVALIRAVERA